MNTATAEVLQALRAVASEDGQVWLVKAKPETMSRQKFAACLSALEAAGLYEPMAGTGFGRVALAAA